MRAHKKTAFHKESGFENCLGKTLGCWFWTTRNGAKTLLKFVDASFGINELILTCKEGMRIRSDAARNHEVLNTIDVFLFSGSSGGASDEPCACGDVHKHDWIIFRMEVCLHSD